MTDNKDKKPPAKRPPRRTTGKVNDALNPERNHRKKIDKPRTTKVAQPAQRHGVYAKFFPDEVIEDAVKSKPKLSTLFLEYNKLIAAVISQGGPG